VLPDINTQGVAVTLHGFDPGGGQPRSLAAVASIPAPAVTVVAALTAAGAQGIAFEIDAVGAGAFGPVTLDLIDNWTLAISGDVGGGGRLQLPRGGPAQVLDPGGAVQVTWTVQRSGTTTTFGPDSGPNLTMSTLKVSAQTALDNAGAPTINYSFSLPDANLSISPSFLSALVGNSLILPVNLDLDANPSIGLKFRSRHCFFTNSGFIELLRQPGFEYLLARIPQFFFQVADFFALLLHGRSEGSALILGQDAQQPLVTRPKPPQRACGRRPLAERSVRR
jgi:hypothetical protein